MSFEYNSSGLRTKKTVGDKTIEYYYAGDLLVAQFDGEYLVNFIYDQKGEAIGFAYSIILANNEILEGDYCYYVKNAQGDILGFYSMFINIYREYTYDAWGNVTGVYNEHGDPVTNLNDTAYLNPLRYRGYYYDDETGLYYLRSRYYNPEWGRFVCADSLVSGTGEDINGYNVYSYCFNNPVNLDDPSGCWPKFLEEAASRLKHTLTFLGRLLTSPLKAVNISVGIGPGIGFKSQVKLKGIPIGIEACINAKDSLVFKKGKFDFIHSTATSLSFKVGKLFEFSRSNSNEHSYFDERCTCDFLKTPYIEKDQCAANCPSKTTSSTLGISMGGYLIVGFEFSANIDLKVLFKEWKSIYDYGLSYGE